MDDGKVVDDNVGDDTLDVTIRSQVVVAALFHSGSCYSRSTRYQSVHGLCCLCKCRSLRAHVDIHPFYNSYPLQ